VEPQELDIDFQNLQVRKAYELAKIDLVMEYASAEGCRRSFLLRYFGETITGDTCGACDRCKSRDTRPDSPEDRANPVLAVKILSGIARLEGRFGAGMAAKVLTGSKDRMLFQFRLERLSTYGLPSDHTQVQVQDWIKELVAMGCVASRKTSLGQKSYSVLELTDRGYRIMSGNEVVYLTPAKLDQRPSPQKAPSLQGVEMEAFSRLRELRTRLAKNESLPPYCIFHDRTLREMAKILPATLEEFLRVSGVGEVTMNKYGDAFLGLLNQIRDDFEHQKILK